MKKNIILGVNYGGHDCAAALMINGKLVASCEEERFNLEKHTRKFPSNAIRFITGFSLTFTRIEASWIFIDKSAKYPVAYKLLSDWSIRRRSIGSPF